MTVSRLQLALRPIAQETAERGPQAAHSVALETLRREHSGLCHKAISENKIALYALLAQLLPLLMTRALEILRASNIDDFVTSQVSRSRSGLHISPLSDFGNPYSPLNSRVKNLLANEVHIFVQQLSEHPLIHEAQEICTQRRRLLLSSQDVSFPDTLENLMIRGVNTAVSVMIRMLQVIPEVMRREGKEFNDEIFVSMARASARTVFMMSMIHIENFTDFNEKLTGVQGRESLSEPFRHQSFSLKIDPEGLPVAVGIREDLLRAMRDEAQMFFTSTPVLGCPAHVKMGDGPNPISLLWDWFIERIPMLHQLDKRQ